MSSYWKDKQVWITGASSGIGEAFAREFAKAGARVILSSRSREKLQSILSELPGDDHKIVTMDVSNESSIQEAIQSNQDLVSSTDILVNNAGISQREVMWNTSRETERRIMETNYFGATSITKAILPGMMERKSDMDDSR